MSVHKFAARSILAASVLSVALAGFAWGQSSSAPAGRLPEARQEDGAILRVSGRYATVDGVRVFYREAGDPSRPTIVLLHGFPTSSFMFRELIPALAKKYHVIAPDYPGFGHSDQPDPARYSYTFDQFACTIDGLLGQLKVDRYALYVQDYGGPVGMRLASAHPERVTGLIVQNANLYEGGLLPEGWNPIFELWKGRTPERDEKVATFLTRKLTEFQYRNGTRNPESLVPDTWVLDQAGLDRPGNREVQISLFYDYQNNPKRYPAWQQYLRDRKPPVLVVWGKNDVFFGTVTPERIRSDVPSAEVHVFDTGHFALEEEVGTIAPTIVNFLDRKVAR